MQPTFPITGVVFRRRQYLELLRAEAAQWPHVPTITREQGLDLKLEVAARACEAMTYNWRQSEPQIMLPRVHGPYSGKEVAEFLSAHGLQVKVAES